MVDTNTRIVNRTRNAEFESKFKRHLYDNVTCVVVDNEDNIIAFCTDDAIATGIQEAYERGEL